jgi:hypothetical protein
VGIRKSLEKTLIEEYEYSHQTLDEKHGLVFLMGFSKDYIFLAFRGTANTKNVFTDISFYDISFKGLDGHPGGVHKGKHFYSLRRVFGINKTLLQDKLL